MFILPAFLLILLLGNLQEVSAQSNEVGQLEKKVYAFNNSFKYDQAQAVINEFLSRPGISDEDSYYAYLYLSYTYKRLFDYHSTLQYLDKALTYGIKAQNREYAINNINCQKALALFDIHRYHESDSLMKGLAKNNYRYLNEEYQAKIFMQEAYLLFLEKNYSQAEKWYDSAIVKMSASSPCDLPMIYGKKIELYGVLHNQNGMNELYVKSIHCGDSCGIVKYNMYTTQMMEKSFESMGNYKSAFRFTKMLDSIKNNYNEKDHLDKITELDKKYQSEKREQEIILQKKAITSKNSAIGLLITSLIIVSLGIALFQFRYRQKKLQREKENTLLFTRQLIEKTEEERKRIAEDLHDSISHELMSLRSSTNTDAKGKSKIDSIINDIRIISRNLHPVMFEKVGLQHSIENLVEQVQQQNKFMLTAEIKYEKCLTPTAELQVYRIIQEAATNMTNHSGAMAGKIAIDQKRHLLRIEIKDNGKGFNVKEQLESTGSFGLLNIINRSHVIGGQANITSGSHGTIINIEIPIS